MGVDTLSRRGVAYPLPMGGLLGPSPRRILHVENVSVLRRRLGRRNLQLREVHHPVRRRASQKHDQHSNPPHCRVGGLGSGSCQATA